MTHPALVNGASAALVIIDIQERLLPVMANADLVVANARRLILGAAELSIPIIVSEQYPKGLGATVEPLRAALEQAAEKTEVRRIEKTSFSCDGSDAFLDALEAFEREQIILCGIESHVCVLQTALNLIEQGAMTFVAADAVSSRNAAHVPLALERMRQAGAVLPVTESILFEMLGDAKHPAFKAVSALVK